MLQVVFKLLIVINVNWKTQVVIQGDQISDWQIKRSARKHQEDEKFPWKIGCKPITESQIQGLSSWRQWFCEGKKKNHCNKILTAGVFYCIKKDNIGKSSENEYLSQPRLPHKLITTIQNGEHHMQNAGACKGKFYYFFRYHIQNKVEYEC